MKRNIIMYIIIALLLACSYMSFSYAYYITNKNTEDTIININIPSCINLNLVDNEGSKIVLEGEKSAPMSDSKAISGYDKSLSYEAMIQNGCNEDFEISLLLTPTSSSSMPHKVVKYAIYVSDNQNDSPIFEPEYMVKDNNKMQLSEQIVEQIASVDGETAEVGYEVANITISKNSTKYIKMISWIDEKEGDLGENVTMNKTFLAHLIMNGKSKNSE